MLLGTSCPLNPNRGSIRCSIAEPVLGEGKRDVFNFSRSRPFMGFTVDLRGLSRAVQPSMIFTLLASFRRDTV